MAALHKGRLLSYINFVRLLDRRDLELPAVIKLFAGPGGRPRGLRRSSAVARLLRLWVRIPPGAWMSV